MIHPHIELRFINEVIGYGCVATRLIPRGTITWVRDDLDRAFSVEEVERLNPVLKPVLDRYTFMDGRGAIILCWDHARFVNHSCRPTCLAPGFDFEIAVRDIHPGEELTDDYGTLNVDDPFPCACGWPDCRGYVRPDDPVRLVPEWDRLVAESWTSFKLVDQPLWPLVREKAEVEAVLRGERPLPSIASHYRAGQVAFARS